jgi:hypothetical protein
MTSFHWHWVLFALPVSVLMLWTGWKLWKTDMKPQLIVMRLADMIRVHPDQITAQCSKCGHTVAVYPSGQTIMREYPDVELVCQICAPGKHENAMLAPGAEFEPSQTQRKQ